jgi:hypothetical protein
MTMPAFKDLTGKKFGRLTVLKFDERDGRSRPHYLCLCRCGVRKSINGCSLTAGDTTSCGCFHKEVMARNGAKSAIDISGQRFGKLVAIRALKQRGNQGQTIWDCLCDCGRHTNVAIATLRNGATKSCGCSRRKKHSGRNRVLSNYKCGARTRGLKWALSNTLAWIIMSKSCHWCGCHPSVRTLCKGKTGNCEVCTNGLDRLDNTKGYIKTNVVSCCGMCNHAKSNRSLSEWRDYRLRLAKHVAALGGLKRNAELPLF